MRVFLVLFLVIISCQNKQEEKSNGIFENSNSFSANQLENKNEIFLEIPYQTTYNYLDSLGKKVHPNKEYDYWGYVTKSEFFATMDLNNITLSEGGNNKLKKHIDYGNHTIGFFQGGQHSFRCNYAVIIDDEKVNYVITEEQFRDFLGTIDNLEEALLLAQTYGYTLDDEGKTNKYRIVHDGYILQLIKVSNYFESAEMVEVRISHDAAIKTKSLGIYKKKNL
ncbi:MAG: hypothetical protein ACOVLC_14520 [Flavobacterium sp.]